jgi:hypothetical protein
MFMVLQLDRTQEAPVVDYIKATSETALRARLVVEDEENGLAIWGLTRAEFRQLMTLRFVYRDKREIYQLLTDI